MKNLATLVLFLASFLLLNTSQLHSDDRIKQQILALFPQSDTNGDEILSDQEYQSVLNLILKRYPQADQDGDGALSIEEQKAILKRAKSRKGKSASSKNKNKRDESPDATGLETLKGLGAKVEVYKNTTDSGGNSVELNIYIFNPKNHQASDSRPAIVFFFGGGWSGGSPAQFASHCKYLADRGMVAMTADYRVSTRQGTKVIACVSDGKSAVRWIRENAERLGVDPTKVAAGGGSAGGHVAACTGLIKTLDESIENSAISSKPNALVLFNPGLVLAPIEGGPETTKRSEAKLAGLHKRVGADPKTISPAHHISSTEPPTIIFHGTEDETVPFQTAELFANRMQKAGNECELIGFEGQGHGFFNYNNKNGFFDATVKEMDRFLIEQGFLAEK